MKYLKRLRQVLPSIIAGLIWGTLWWYFDNRVAHALIIALIWTDKQLLARKVEKKP